MKLKIKKLIKFLATGIALAPSWVLAQYGDDFSNGLNNSEVGTHFSNNPNTISGAHSLTQLIGVIVRYLLLFGGAVAVVFVIIGGYQYITSAGNEEQAEKGQKTLTNAIIGVIVIILSYTIITVISNLVSSPGGYGF